MIEKINDAYTLRFDYVKNWRQKLIFMSDLHYDSKYCDRTLLKNHLDYARDNNALVFMFGDIFDCMGGRYDKRANKEDLREEYRKADYFDALINDATRFFKPYKDNIIFISDGNHEASILKHHETDLIERLADPLDATHGSYMGFIRIMFEYNGGGHRRSLTMYYNHGSGGSAPVTKGVIKSNRRQVMVDADIYVSGHNHNEWVMPITHAKLSSGGNVVIEKKLHINLGCYKDEWGKTDFAQMSEFDPENKGAFELELYYHNKEIKKTYRALE